MRNLSDVDVKNKRVLVRCDFNVPLLFLEGETTIKDDFRIVAALPTINYLLEKEAKVILMSHLGQPKGKTDKLSLRPVQEKLMEYLDISITFAPDCIGSETEKWSRSMMPGEVLLLENLRFHDGEEKGDAEFAKGLARLGDVFINDAFGACHRPHASISVLPTLLPSFAGLLLSREIEMLEKVRDNPSKPLLVIIGGAKAETKVPVINMISDQADWVLVSGLVQKGIKEKNIVLKNPEKIIGPLDENEGKDIGPLTVNLFEEKILEANTIFWNGPMGKIEEEKYSYGTGWLARCISDATGRALTVIGGGETVEFVSKEGFLDKFSHVSTGGGAMLEFLAGKKLPGIEVLK